MFLVVEPDKRNSFGIAFLQEGLKRVFNRFGQVILSRHEHHYDRRVFTFYQLIDGLGIIERIGALAKQNKISIDAVLQLPVGSQKSLPFVITTNECTASQVTALAAGLQKQKFVTKKPLVLPIVS